MISGRCFSAAVKFTRERPNLSNFFYHISLMRADHESISGFVATEVTWSGRDNGFAYCFTSVLIGSDRCSSVLPAQFTHLIAQAPTYPTPAFFPNFT